MAIHSDLEGDDKLKVQDLLKTIKPLYKKRTPTPLKEAENFTFLAKHYTMTYLAETLDVSRSYITTRISLLNLIPGMQEALKDERIGFWDAYHVSKSNEWEQTEALKGLEEEENDAK